ncbi:TVP38/TMEM64 family protein [Acaryochloris sp. IP29b_bin.148]|uniref:TVP38/TMEM64 family protein n=1 Tax=Acaryochloris sp. IP29b_bin.148 TaxID=2969218 RepID=UPI002639BFCC|nr:TVP38/TMEM64 family protein [Acaryochloris sp. IP29b_bin.148]
MKRAKSLTPRQSLLILTVVCVIATGIALLALGKLDTAQIKGLVSRAGIWGPIYYILAYVIATLLVLPSTALNLTGGGLFGPWLGTLWTSLAAIIAAVVAFYFSRTIGRESIAKRLAGRWQKMDTEVKRGGLFYMFAIRLVPIMPYGLVNFAAGLTSIRFRDFLIGTILGTIPSVLPFVLLGSSSVQALTSGSIAPLIGALALTGILVAGSTYWQRQQGKRK